MKRMALISLLLAVVVVLPSLASATDMYVVEGTADCTSWFMSTGITWRGDFYNGVIMNYEFFLVDDLGNQVDHVVGSEPIEDGSLIYDFGDRWSDDLELCGVYTVTGSFNLDAPWEDLFNGWSGVDRPSVDFPATTFECICDVPNETCHFTPGYWKNHPEMWPVTSLMIGGQPYEQDALLEIMATPVRGDATIILTYHLIAGMLNVENGADNSIGGSIDEANLFLELFTIGSKPMKGNRATALDLKDLLATYNEMGCPDSYTGDLDKAAETSEESTNWGSLKSMYR